MAKKLMSFKFDEDIANYLQYVVKNSDMSMTEYIETIIDIDRDAKCGIDGWEYGSIITSDDQILFINEPYYNAMINIIRKGVGIVAAIPDSLIPVSKCIEMATAQRRKDEDILWGGEPERIQSINVGEANIFADYLASTFQVDVKAGII